MAQNPMKIGNYILMETLGVGSFGKVKLAVHSTTGHRVAMKIINRRRIATMNMVERIKREIQYLKLLRHPHIIKLYEVITTPTDIIMVMEYAPFELFNFIVEKGKVTEDETRRFFQQIISAVEYCHRHKIVHRDLKPENVLLDENYNVKIADFGLSNIMTDGDFLKTSCGSPNYAAPEVINGKLYAGPEVDVWSCGVMLYVMLCGRLPFDDEYIPLLFKKISGGIFTLPSHLSPETKQLLSSMLVVDPLKRITIENIRKNKWFNTNLPDYLKPITTSPSDFSNNIDENIINELRKKLGYSREQILRGLKSEGENQIKVACALVIDHKRMINDAQNTNIESFLAQSPPAWDAIPNSLNAKDGFGSISPSIQILSSSLPKRPYYNPDMNSNLNSLPPVLPASPATNINGNQNNQNKNMIGLGVSTIGNSNNEGPIGNSSVVTGITNPSISSTTNMNGVTSPSSLRNSTTNNVVDPSNTTTNTISLPTAIPTSTSTPLSNSIPSTPNTSIAGAGRNPIATPIRKHKTRSKWHFGIRSKSLPLDIMLEIYKALKKIGMKWKSIDQYHIRVLYESKCNTKIKFDIQLYQIENNSYLVDFKDAMPPTRTVAQNPIRDEPITSTNPINISNDITNNSLLINNSSTFSNTKSQPVNIKKSSNLTKQIKNNSAFNTDNRNNLDQLNNDFNINDNMDIDISTDKNVDDMYETMIAENFDKMNLMFVPEEEEVNLRAFIFFEACSKLITELALSS
ncbi:Pkinase-domain-containing protein [Anaeromyces robustus]|uniref:non-specific serine/threonine protein kinase n=1 Tax=Anaeromyces robustus TaxID=1754192 RepID=A0A1Y1X7U6_9FUNG|nr:Pkinase-domain-containing protein [Anaeromyces robustus]|eukprot:ORX81830.1 Pkinase-domain-containing protein [Anaeromyces robustus]